MIGVLHTARINAIEFIVCSDLSLSHARVMLINSPSHFTTELKIHHLYQLITTHDEFDSVDPSSMQDTYHI